MPMNVAWGTQLTASELRSLSKNFVSFRSNLTEVTAGSFSFIEGLAFVCIYAVNMVKEFKHQIKIGFKKFIEKIFLWPLITNYRG